MWALLTNSRVPVMTATAKATQVHRKVSFDIWVAVQDRDVSPSRRRSMIATVPTTVTMAMTWVDSMAGKAHDEEATKSPTGEASRAGQRDCRFIGFSSNAVGDPAAHDHG